MLNCDAGVGLVEDDLQRATVKFDSQKFTADARSNGGKFLLQIGVDRGHVKSNVLACMSVCMFRVPVRVRMYG